MVVGVAVVAGGAVAAPTLVAAVGTESVGVASPVEVQASSADSTTKVPAHRLASSMPQRYPPVENGAGSRSARCDTAPMGENHFDEPAAARYDVDLGAMGSPAEIAPVVDVLTELAGEGGSALEFAIGTGRIALPLAARGVSVSGIELSEAMVRRLRAKPGGDSIDVAVGDMATERVEGSFDLVYLVFNTIGNLTTQAAQVACFRNAATHLRRGGCFLVEVGMPDLRRLPPGETLHVFDRSDDHVGIDEYDVATQGLISHHYHLIDDRWELASLPFRYVWPGELDLMAELAGMTPRDRWSNWHRDPFTHESRSTVSVWELPT